MKKGTVVWKIYDGAVYHGTLEKVSFDDVDNPDSFITLSAKPEKITSERPEPFNDGKYLHYTRFHTQLKDMIGTEGYFYDEQIVFMGLGRLSGINKDGCPCNENRAFCYFAVPIEKPKTEITLQEIADKFGVSVEQIRIKE